MKYFIVGLHASGKHEVINNLKKMGIKCGSIFSNIEPANKATDSANVYGKNNYEYYDISEICKLFENNAYLFLHEIPGLLSFDSTCKYYEGLSAYEFDNNDVFVISPDQLLNILPNSIKEPICFVWMDAKQSTRKIRFYSENRNYNFNEREAIEKRDINLFIKTMYGFNNSNVLYFNNEEPERVAAIIYSLIKHPDLFDVYSKKFI